jgi:hypothetical protein
MGKASAGRTTTTRPLRRPDPPAVPSAASDVCSRIGEYEGPGSPRRPGVRHVPARQQASARVTRGQEQRHEDRRTFAAVAAAGTLGDSRNGKD